MDEQQAILQVEQATGHEYEYLGDDKSFFKSIGHFEVLDDMNCCAPTNSVLFAFYTGTRRKVMSADEFLEFFAHCLEVKEDPKNQ